MMEIFKHTGEFVLEAHGRPVRSQLCVSAKIVLLIVQPALEHPPVNVPLASHYIIILEHLVRPATLIVQFVQVQAVLNVLPVVQDTSCSQLLQQHVFPLAQMDIGRTMQITFVHLVMLLALFAQAQTTRNVLLATRGTFDTRRRRQLALILVQMDTMELPVAPVRSVMLIAQFVRVQPLIIVLPANQGTFFQHLHLV